LPLGVGAQGSMTWATKT